MVSSSVNQNPSLTETSSLAKDSLSGASRDQTQSKGTQGQTLTQRLLTYVLPTALIPLIVAGAVEFFTVKQKAKTQALENLKLESLLAAEAANVFVVDTLKIPEVIGLNPSVRQALVTDANKAVSKNWHTTPIDALETSFSSTKLLTPNSSLNQYLRDVALVEGFGEIFFTERHGFNVAYSNVTSDFVQRDEEWWQVASQKGYFVSSVVSDESAGIDGIEMSRSILEPSNNNFLGVIKTLVPVEALHIELTTLLSAILQDNQVIEILDARSGTPVAVVSSEGTQVEAESLLGTESIKVIAKELDNALNTPDYTVDDIIEDIRAAVELPDLQIELEKVDQENVGLYLSSLFKLEGIYYSITTVPGTNWVALAVINEAEVNAAGNDLIRTFGVTTLTLALVATVVLSVLARQLASPLKSLTSTAAAAAGGQLEIRAPLAGTVETKTLGAGFNSLLNQLQTLLQEQTAVAQEQERQRAELENEIAQLMEDVGDAADGDLRVRAQLSEGDVGIVADLFNSIIENLRLTTKQVKKSTGQVTSSLSENEAAIQELSVQAVAEVESLKDTMEAVEDIGQSIQEVANNAGEASVLTQDTYATVKAGTSSMDQTVASIVGLRSTVGETAKKIKRLGESAQKISQTVSLIDEIALKTNLLAVNASVEAARAGEMGEGFTAVAEQVGSLAEQSSSATKEISQIVAEIQTETQEVVESIETGTAQVVDSTNLVETTKRRLTEALNKSEQINELMQQISASTKYQTESSSAVNALVREVAEESEKRSESAQQMAQAMKDATEVAQELEASVEQFKIDDEN
ncbi:methyl-accepting chemotaxis protein [Leptothoe sp. EHU-05/26/07-4]